MSKWEIARSSGVCAVSGRALVEGEEYYVVLFEDGEGFRRMDYALENWTGPPDGAYCSFKSRIPTRQEKKRVFVDDDLLANLFMRLGEETQEMRLQFRFVLALVLMRKRLLRYEQTVHEEGLEYWRMRLVRERTMHRVLNPHLTDEQVAGVSRQLGAILHGDMGEFGEEGAEAWSESDPDAGEEERQDA